MRDSEALRRSPSPLEPYPRVPPLGADRFLHAVRVGSLAATHEATDEPADTTAAAVGRDRIEKVDGASTALQREPPNWGETRAA